MRAGTLRHRVTIQARDESIRDAHGQPVVSWPELGIRWASITPLSGRELFAAQQFGAEVDHEIRIRWDRTIKAVTPKGRIAYGSRLFDIEAVINVDERDRELLFLVTEAA